jgi:hypothetical protein
MGDITTEPPRETGGARVEAGNSPERAGVSVDAVMADVQGRVRERLRGHVLRHGGSRAFEDAQLFAEVERFLFNASDSSDPNALILPEYLGEPETWRLETAIRYKSHRGGAAGRALLFVKRRLLMPVLRWLFEYSRDNFERQRRVNHVLIACVQDLAVETARLRSDVRRLSGPAAAAARQTGAPGGR